MPTPLLFQHILSMVGLGFIFRGYGFITAVQGLGLSGSLHGEIDFQLLEEINPLLLTGEAWRMWEGEAQGSRY